MPSLTVGLLTQFVMTLEELNSLTSVAANEEFLKCCGSMRWADQMSVARPFGDFDHLTKEADLIWWSLAEEDWLEAFHAHPKIGERKAAAEQSKQAQSWSAQEQAGVANAARGILDELARQNREYEARFGFIFIVCATGKSPEEMLTILQSRIGNDRPDELLIAAEEQRKITRLRLEKLLNQ
jgi:OHCU decarboxylase